MLTPNFSSLKLMWTSVRLNLRGNLKPHMYKNYARGSLLYLLGTPEQLLDIRIVIDCEAPERQHTKDHSTLFRSRGSRAPLYAL